ncbi:MAG: hypothetical protein WBL40_00490, partial [Terrimicrobiaceae bacterium]
MRHIHLSAGGGDCLIQAFAAESAMCDARIECLPWSRQDLHAKRDIPAGVSKDIEHGGLRSGEP